MTPTGREPPSLPRRVAVVHSDINTVGGAEAVCAEALEALSDSCEVTLFAWSQPDFPRVDRLFGTRLAERGIRVVSVASLFRLPHRLRRSNLLRFALASRAVQDRARDFDWIASTYGEIAAPLPAIQYVHFPLYSGLVTTELLGGGRRSAATEAWRRLARAALRRAARGSRGAFARNRTLTNSAFTAGWLRRAWGIDAAVVRPPVPFRASAAPRPFEAREGGVVCVGRLTPAKRTLDLIAAVGEVRRRGLDARIHVVGEGTGPYADAVRDACRRSDHATYEGVLSLADLSVLLARNRYGVHGFEHEHFGISVAQMVRAGCLCFAPAGGGQAELLAAAPRLLYRSVPELVSKLAEVMGSPALQTEALRALAPVKAELDGDRFGAAFIAQARSHLGV